MTYPILDRDPKVGKRWPYRFLNFLPSRQLWRFLTWQSGGTGSTEPFEVAKALCGTSRILVVLPEGIREILVSVPIIQAYFQTLPQAAIWLMAGPRESSFLAGIFGRERILTMEPDNFFMGEDHFKELLGRLHGMRPDLVLNFRSQSPPLLHYLLRGSHAPLRIQLGSGPQWPYWNITLAANEPLNHLRHYQMAARLWDAAGIPLAGKWSRIVPPADAMARAELLLAPARLKAASTLVFPWQNRPEGPQLSLLKSVAQVIRAEGKSLAVIHSVDPLFASPPLPSGVADSYPILKTDSAGTLMALFATTAGTIGQTGPLLLLAGLTDTDVTGYFTAEDAPFDTSFLNPRLKVLPLEPEAPEDKTQSGSGKRRR